MGKPVPRLGQRARVRQAIAGSFQSHAQALTEQATVINQNAETLQAHDQALAAHVAVIGASFWGRLRWLLFGLRLNG